MLPNSTGEFWVRISVGIPAFLSFFVVFLGPSRRTAGQYLEIGYGFFLPNPF
jgi:hypothetical protein